MQKSQPRADTREASRVYNMRFEYVLQSCPWVGSTRGLGWVGSGLGRDFAVFWWLGLSWVEYDKSIIFFDDYTTHNFKGPCKLNTRGMKNWRFSTNISLYLENGTRYGHSYNGRPLTADSFAVSCIGLGWVWSILVDLRWVALDWVWWWWCWWGEKSTMVNFKKHNYQKFQQKFIL